MTITATIAGAISMIAQFGMFFHGNRSNNGPGLIGSIAMMILAPLAAMLIQLAISRSREYDADAASAKYVGSPYPLIGGLQKLDTYSKRIPMDANPSTAHMFIVNPFTMGGISRLFATHPPIEERIARLQGMR